MVYLETIMLIALGFVLASLIALFLLRIVWHHGERVGRRRVQRQFPTTSEELRADRARLRAENAMLARRHELRIQDYKLQLQERNRDIVQVRAELEELGQELRQRDDQIAKLRASRTPLEEELAERTSALQSLQRSARDYLDQIQKLSRELEEAHEALRERDKQIEALQLQSETMASARPAETLHVPDTKLWMPSSKARPNGIANGLASLDIAPRSEEGTGVQEPEEKQESELAEESIELEESRPAPTRSTEAGMNDDEGAEEADETADRTIQAQAMGSAEVNGSLPAKTEGSEAITSRKPAGNNISRLKSAKKKRRANRNPDRSTQDADLPKAVQ